MAYETFERTAVRVENPTVSVAKEGRIAFNAAASRLLAKAGANAVRILWDKTTCGIALQAAQKGDKNAFSVAFSRGQSATITAKRFFEYIGWSATQRQTVPAEWDEKQRMLEAKLPARFVSSVARRAIEIEAHAQKLGKSAKFRSPGVGGNIQNWMALNEAVPKK